MGNIREFMSKIDNITDNVIAEVGKAIVKSGMLIERDAKINCPVDTGYLRNSISAKYEGIGTDKPTCEILIGAEYATFIEYGTSKMAAQPFLRPAVEKNRDKINEMIKDAMKKKLK